MSRTTPGADAPSRRDPPPRDQSPGRLQSMAGAEVAPDLADRLGGRGTLFRAVFDANIVGVLIAARARVVEANDAFLRIVGRSRAEMLAGRLEWGQFQPPDTLRTSGAAPTG